MTNSPTTTGRRGGRTLLALAAVLAVVVGIAVIAFAIATRPQPPPAPVAFGTIEGPGASAPAASGPASQSATLQPSPAAGSASTPPVKRPVPASRPVRVDIPSIGVHSDVIRIGLADDGTIAVPSGRDIDKAAWYEGSPTPGQDGPSIIEGHIDSAAGPSVFYRLADLRSGDRIKVTRADGQVAVYTVNGLRNYLKSDFPARAVYGGDLAEPTLRLITCANFDRSIGHYAGNTVVYSHLTELHG